MEFFSMQVSCWFCWFRLLVCNLHEGEERVTALKKPSIVFCWFTVSTTWGSQQDSGQGYEGVHHQTSWKGVLSKVPNEKNLHSMSLITSICYRSIDLHSMEGLLALLFWLTHSKFHRSIFPFLRDNIDSQPLWRKTSCDPRPVLANLVAAVLRVKVGKKLGKSGGNWVPMKNRCCCTIHVWIQFGGPKNSHLFPVAWKKYRQSVFCSSPGLPKYVEPPHDTFHSGPFSASRLDVAWHAVAVLQHVNLFDFLQKFTYSTWK